MGPSTTSSRADGASLSHRVWTDMLALLFILTGICQPLLMTQLKMAGLANPKAQLYLVFYYLGPSTLLIITGNEKWPKNRIMCYTAMAIASLDVFSQALNYTGAGLAGPTIFAIVYSSVTVWTALWAKCILNRKFVPFQWLALFLVFGGLALTALFAYFAGGGTRADDDKNAMVIHGTILTLIGSTVHGGAYVWSEVVLTGPSALTVSQNAGLQAWTAASLLILWQVCYTAPRWEELIHLRVTWWSAAAILFAFGFCNTIHSYSFFHTIKFFKGGSVMAGVFKGLQAVLVSVATQFVYCGRTGGQEMCLTSGKLASLITVVGGVILFAIATPPKGASSDVHESTRDGLAMTWGSTILEEDIDPECKRLLPQISVNSSYKATTTLDKTVAETLLTV